MGPGPRRREREGLSKAHLTRGEPPALPTASLHGSMLSVERGLCNICALMFSRWLEPGEHEVDGLASQGFLQGILLSEVSEPRPTVATQRRIVMFRESPDAGRRTRVRGRSRDVCFDVPWSMVKGYWTGIMPFPPDLWRVGPEGEVVVFSLDPAVADGHDLVVLLTSRAWVDLAQSLEIPEVRD